jgi:hypothetical protein
MKVVRRADVNNVRLLLREHKLHVVVGRPLAKFRADSSEVPTTPAIDPPSNRIAFAWILAIPPVPMIAAFIITRPPINRVEAR